MNRTVLGLALLAALILIPGGARAAEPMACPEIYQPVCGAYQVQCIKAPCYPQYKTYSNSCFLNADKAEMVHEGECTADETGPYKGGGNAGGVYTPPANCSASFDGCNSCSRTSANGPAMCTLMACTEDTKPGYCRAYFPNGNIGGTVTPPSGGTVTPPPVATSSEPIPVEPDGGIGDTPHQGFFASIWKSVTDWFRSLF